jgi:MFS family permease
MTRTGRYKIQPIIGLTVLAVGFLLLSTLTPTTDSLRIGIYMAIVGLGMGLLMPVLTTSVQNAAPREMLGAATASSVMFRQVGGSLGVALFGALFASLLAANLPPFPGGGSMTGDVSPQMLAKLPPALHETVTNGVVDALHPIFQIAAVMAVLGLILSFFLKEIPLRSRAKLPQRQQPVDPVNQRSHFAEEALPRVAKPAE